MIMEAETLIAIKVMKKAQNTIVSSLDESPPAIKSAITKHGNKNNRNSINKIIAVHQKICNDKTQGTKTTETVSIKSCSDVLH